MNTTVAIEPFDATFTRQVDGTPTRLPCRVVGITQTSSGSLLVVLRRSADGTVWAEELSEVTADELTSRPVTQPWEPR
jgi:hypothetical protein